jgi:hypothetical protein
MRIAVALQKELDSITVKTYSGIWKDEVTTADWPDKSESIRQKKIISKTN